MALLRHRTNLLLSLSFLYVFPYFFGRDRPCDKLEEMDQLAFVVLFFFYLRASRAELDCLRLRLWATSFRMSLPFVYKYLISCADSLSPFQLDCARRRHAR